ncbi:DUF2807 domain-containing protein [Aequorivita sp. H23M31]|uniref:DUF2807 domain-containing protein n=1 Tax=Aequorivita ciconiae TaxID=2494375 RepID=A0A410G6X7_9FLAO|nr:head GIN domain-containing protein [Aequorivita sp. H23M31]QAA83033.1 DUF2807 domain-containing protein [Aequorivita sp. H23M31]
MKTTNLIFVLAASLILSACSFNLGKKGNGNVITQERTVSENFTEVRGSAGLNVYLTQGTENKIEVEADENLQQYIETNIKEGKLHITTSENIGWSKAKKVYVTFVELTKLEASSGADIIGNSTIKSEILALKATSGADLKVEVFSRELTAESSSGADVKISGKATSFTGKASSGSHLNAKDLLTINCKAEASSGADITVNVKEKLDANASSGADIKYLGNPTSVNSNKSSSGSVSKKS